MSNHPSISFRGNIASADNKKTKRFPSIEQDEEHLIRISPPISSSSSSSGIMSDSEQGVPQQLQQQELVASSAGPIGKNAPAKSPFISRILSLLYNNQTVKSVPAVKKMSETVDSPTEGATLASIHTLLRSSRRQLETTSEQEFHFLSREAIRMGFESIARLFIEYGHLDVSVLYDRDLWKEGKERIKQRGDYHLLSTNYIAASSDGSSRSQHQRVVKRYDRYGFQMEKKPQPVLKLNDYMDRKQQSRLKKWNRMLKWRNPLDKGLVGMYRRKKFKKRVRKGIPYNVRKEAWRKMIPLEKLKKKNPSTYSNCLSQPGNYNYTKVIDCDVMRQSRRHRFFEEKFSPEMISLFNILKAYSVYDPEVCYCQGMSSIAATMLIVFEDELDAFWAFVHVMNSPEHAMRDAFSSQFSLLKESYWIHDKMLELYLPKLKKHFDQFNVISEYYATKNYLTVFMDLFSFDVAILIFDNFILDGRRMTFSFSKALMELLAQELVKDSFEIMLPKLQHLDELENIDLHALMNHKRMTKSRMRELHLMYVKYQRREKKKERASK